MTCSAGESAVITSWPIAFSRMWSIEFLDDLEVDVGFKQRQANLAQGLLNVFFGERALAAQVLECAL